MKITPPTPKVRILIVEDDHATSTMMEATLTDAGHEVTLSPDAEKAWEILENEKPFDLAYLDVNLPGMSGIDLCQKIRRSPKHQSLYIVVATSKNKPEDLKEVLKNGANDYMAKPVQPSFLAIRTTVCLFTIERIKEAKKFEADLMKSEARYRIISENGRDIVSTQKRDGTITYLSPSVENLLGHRVAGMIGEKLQSFIHPEDLAQAIPKEPDDDILNGNLENTTEFRMRRFDGKYIWVEALNRPIQDENNNIKEWISYIREIQPVRSTDRRLAGIEALVRNFQEDLPKLLERTASAFNGNVYIFEEPILLENPVKVVHSTNDDWTQINSCITLLRQGIQQHRSTFKDPVSRSSAFIITQGLDTLLAGKEKSAEDTSHWEFAAIQPLPQLPDQPENFLVVVGENPLRSQEEQAVKTALALAAGLLLIKLEAQKPAASRGETPAK